MEVLGLVGELKCGVDIRDLHPPAPERIPATEAVAMIEPPGAGLSGWESIIAFEACLTARNTLPRGGGGHVSRLSNSELKMNLYTLEY